jgi:hypothetical protein
MGIKLEYQEPGIYEMTCDSCNEEQIGPVKISVICEHCIKKLKELLEKNGIEFNLEIKKIIE